jgi:hypothetical protein
MAEMHHGLPVSDFKVCYSTLKMEAAGSSEILVLICKSKRHQRHESFRLRSLSFFLKLLLYSEVPCKATSVCKTVTIPPGK